MRRRGSSGSGYDGRDENAVPISIATAHMARGRQCTHRASFPQPRTVDSTGLEVQAMENLLQKNAGVRSMARPATMCA